MIKFNKATKNHHFITRNKNAEVTTKIQIEKKNRAIMSWRMNTAAGEKVDGLKRPFTREAKDISGSEEEILFLSQMIFHIDHSDQSS